MAVTKDYSGFVLFAFENGKIAKLPLSVYATKTNRKKLTGAYSNKCSLCSIVFISHDCEILLTSSKGRLLIFHTASVTEKTSRTTIGVNVMTLKKGQRLMSAEIYTEGKLSKPDRYRTKNIPAAGSLLSPSDKAEQLTLI